LHEVRRARHHHHQHHNHNFNHHGINGENVDDVFVAAPSSRGGHILSAPVVGSFGRDDALVWMRRGERGDEGGAGTDTWVDTDTDTDAGADADADDDGDSGLWLGEATDAD
jgi:hypothetical protein